MNDYLIPANSKRGKLIFNMFRLIDIWVIAGGAITTTLLVLLFQTNNVFLLIAELLPLGIALLLVVPIDNYHNVLVFLQEIYLFLVSQKRYQWRGWCASNGAKREERN